MIHYGTDKEIREEAEDFLTKRFLGQTEWIQNYYLSEMEEITEEFYGKIHQALSILKVMQNKMIKTPIQYICFSFLQSSIYTKSYDYLIAFYDSAFYMDRNDINFYWSPIFIMKFFEQDMEAVMKHLKLKFYRISNLMIEQIRNWYVYSYYIVVKRFLEEQSIVLLGIIDEYEIIRADDLKILFGGYMEQMTEITFPHMEGGEV